MIRARHLTDGFADLIPGGHIASHGENRGSSPLGSANKIKYLFQASRLLSNNCQINIYGQAWTACRFLDCATCAILSVVQGVYRGLAQHMDYGSYVAACAEVSVDKGAVKIHRMIAATDPGHAVNPAQIERQIAGSFVYGLSALFYQECTVHDGAIEQTNFDSYDSIRISEMPKVECIIMPSGGFWGGVGEPTIFVAAPAVLNAIFAATGQRFRSFPLKNHNIRLA